MNRIIILTAAFLFDCAAGDPHWLYHPVMAIGFLITKGELFFRRVLKGHELLGGAFLSIFVGAVSFAVPFFILKWLYSLNTAAAAIFEGIMCWQMLAAKCLKDETMRVYRCLAAGDIDGARRFISYIVGRDTEKLDGQQIVKAAVETVAENTSDGVIAPMFWFMIGGAPLMFLYKAVNTLDSMIGYKNDKYILFGRFAAKTDDVFNFIPAIISGHLFIVSAALCGFDGAAAARIYRRDRKKHASPNSGKPESAVAGALGIRLAGDACYFGKVYHKPFIGDDKCAPEAEDIRRAVKLMYTASATALILAALVAAAVYYL